MATFYALYATTPRAPVVAHVCDDIACRIAGGEAICADLRRTLGEAGEPTRDGSIGWLRSPCLGLCDLAPAAMITAAGEGAPVTVSLAPTDAAAVVARLEAGGGAPRATAPIRQGGSPELRLLRRVGVVDPVSDNDYWEHGGYRGLMRAFEIGAEAVIAEVTASKLMGRGGPALPTGRKWGAVAAQTAGPKYVICNADEGEPGTFKDRTIIERNPHSVVEGCIIGCYGIGAHKAYIYLREEYLEAEGRLWAAIAEAKAKGYLGAKPFGVDYPVDVIVHTGAGAYICGEETALLNSLEGKRGEPRPSRRSPAQAGRLRHAEHRQQPRDHRHRPDGPRDGRRGLRRDRDRGLDRAEAVLPVRSRGATRDVRGRVRRHAARYPSTWPAASPMVMTSGPSCSAARPACSWGQHRRTCP